MKFTSLSIAASLCLFSTPSGVEACLRRNLVEDSFEDGVPIIPLTIRAGIIPGAFPVFLNRDDDGSISGFLMDWLDEIKCIAMVNSANPYHYNITYDFVDLEGLPNVSTYNGAEATITDGCQDLAATDGVGCLDMLIGDYFITSERTQQFTFPPQPFAASPVVGFYSRNSVSHQFFREIIMNACCQNQSTSQLFSSYHFVIHPHETPEYELYNH